MIEPVFALVATALEAQPGSECSSWVYDLLADRIRLDPALVRDLDLNEDEMSLERFLPCLEDPHRERFRSRLSLASQGEPCVLDCRLTGSSNQSRKAQLLFQSIANPDGPVRFIAGVVAWQSESESQPEISALTSSSVTSLSAAGLSPSGWRFDVGSRSLLVGSELARLLGKASGAVLSEAAWGEILHPDDHSRFEALIHPRHLKHWEELIRLRGQVEEELSLLLSGSLDDAGEVWSGQAFNVSNLVRRESLLRSRLGALQAAVSVDRGVTLVLRAVPETGTPKDFEVIAASKGSELILGIGPRDRGKLLTEASPIAKRSGFLSRSLGVMLSGLPDHSELRTQVAGLREMVLDLHLSPIPQGILVQAEDCTLQRLAEARESRANKLLERAIGLTREYLFLWDLEAEQSVFESRSLLDSLGSGSGRRLDSASFLNAIHPEDRPLIQRALSSRAQGRVPIANGTVIRAIDVAGNIHAYRISSDEFAHDETGVPTQILFALEPTDTAPTVPHDIHERMERLGQAKDELESRQRQLEELNVRLGNLAWTDGLTGLKNHRAFQDRLLEEVARAQRYGLPLSLMLIDIDHFKQFNDQHGHPVGDQLLRDFAQLLASCARATDFVVRYGGEEFAIILPSTSADEASCLAERIRTSLQESEIGKYGVTASYGCAQMVLGGDARYNLVANADAALYRSKRSGRDRVSLFVPESL